MSEQKQEQASNKMLNQVRAAVLGANDGIISTAAVVMGVAGATNNATAIITAGMAALVAGAFSMAVGEYVSVSSQSDAEKNYIEREKVALAENPEEELKELTDSYVARGVSEETAQKVAKELTEKDALKAHLELEFGLEEDDISSPTGAAVASFLAFSAGGLVPFAVSLLVGGEAKVVSILVATLIALAVTGYLSAKVTDVSKTNAVVRVLLGGVVAMAITYLVGMVFGQTVL